MQREKLAERGRGAGRSPTAAGGESRLRLLCSGGAGTGCARFCGPGKCGGQVQGGAAAGQGSGLRRAGAGGRCVVGLAAGRCKGLAAGRCRGLRRAGAAACGGQVQGVGAWWGLRRAGAGGGEGRRPPRRSRGRRASPAETVRRTV